MAQGVFFNIPFHGHINPTLPLVAELTRRGDHITYYSSEAFRPAIEQAGATFRGIDAFFTEQTPVDANLVRFAYTLIHATQQILPSLLDEVRANRRSISCSTRSVSGAGVWPRSCASQRWPQSLPSQGHTRRCSAILS